MSLPLSVSMLRTKRNEIRDTIAAYEAKLSQAQADLAHVERTLRLFDASDDPYNLPKYVDLSRIFRRGDILPLCLSILAQESPLDTRQITERIMKGKGLDTRDKVLVQAISMRVVDTLRFRARRRADITSTEKRRGVCLWKSSA
jgi:hypothetical protein